MNHARWAKEWVDKRWAESVAPVDEIFIGRQPFRIDGSACSQGYIQ